MVLEYLNWKHLTLATYSGYLIIIFAQGIGKLFRAYLNCSHKDGFVITIIKLQSSLLFKCYDILSLLITEIGRRSEEVIKGILT